MLHVDNPALEELESVKEIEDGLDIVPRDDGTHKPGDIYLGTGVEFPGDDPDTPGIDIDFGSILDGVHTDEAIYGLDTIEYYDPETGRVLQGEVIEALSREEKYELILRYITEGTPEEIESTKRLWEEYLHTMDTETLDIAVYKILMTD